MEGQAEGFVPGVTRGQVRLGHEQGQPWSSFVQKEEVRERPKPQPQAAGSGKEPPKESWLTKIFSGRMKTKSGANFIGNIMSSKEIATIHNKSGKPAISSDVLVSKPEGLGNQPVKVDPVPKAIPDNTNI